LAFLCFFGGFKFDVISIEMEKENEILAKQIETLTRRIEENKKNIPVLKIQELQQIEIDMRKNLREQDKLPKKSSTLESEYQKKKEGLESEYQKKKEGLESEYQKNKEELDNRSRALACQYCELQASRDRVNGVLNSNTLPPSDELPAPTDDDWQTVGRQENKLNSQPQGNNERGRLPLSNSFGVHDKKLRQKKQKRSMSQNSDSLVPVAGPIAGLAAVTVAGPVAANVTGPIAGLAAAPVAANVTGPVAAPIAANVTGPVRKWSDDDAEEANHDAATAADLAM
jgi:hypothetical protein